MARSTNRSAKDGDSRVSASTDRAEARDLSDPRELSLEEVLKSYEQPINEEQAWAMCYQCCSWLRVPRPATVTGGVYWVKDPSSILLLRDGTVSPKQESDDTDGPPLPPITERQLVQSLGVAIYQALDWGLDDSEERELSPQLERLIERMAGGNHSLQADSGGGNGTTDEGYSGQEEEEEEGEKGAIRPVCTFSQVMTLCTSRLANPSLAPEHYQAVCRALFVETLELQTFLIKIRNAKEMLKKINGEDPQEDQAEIDALKHTDWTRLWVQLMKELRQGVKLKKVQEHEFDTLPTEFSLTPFEMLMQDIRTRKFQLRKVMEDGDIPTRVKRNAHEFILDFIRSRPPLKPDEESPGELCRAESFPTSMKRDRSFSEHDLAELRGEILPSLSESAHLGRAVLWRGERPRSHTLSGAGPPPTHRGWVPLSPARISLSSVDETTEGAETGSSSRGGYKPKWMEEFSHPVESLALTVDEVINVRRVLVKAEMEKYLQNKELYYNLRRGKVCCCCRIKFPLFSWPSTCLLCKRSVCGSCSAKMKIPSKKMAHIPVYTVGFHSSPKSHGRKSEVYKSLRTLSRRSVEEEFPHLYAHGCSLRDVCVDCTKFVADVISSSRKSLDILNNTPKRESATPKTHPQPHASPHPPTLKRKNK
ncbi:protein spire homolog 2-like isoform X2 [Oncorhynchus clarkii lewisi]|uniref:protein spire homolog 2-like isoform X2 n=1 Tax=Oncorhynchus clarkii lewisi TaxID=490388 RepID=UPI0039B9ABB9